MSPPAKLRIGDWLVDPATGQISRGGEVVRVEARTLRLLLDLAERQGQVVSIDDLLDRVWAGVIVTPDSVYQAVAALRRVLGDDPKRPRYIATVPRLGYRMVAPVEAVTVGEGPAAAPSLPPAGSRRPGRVAAALAAGGALVLGVAVIAAGQVARGPAAKAPQPAAVGVMPFLDLTDNMDQIKISDDLTEGVIDRLAKNPRIRTPGFRDAFLLRGRRLSPRQAAQALGVAYVVDGALHSSPKGLRVTARLVRADNGFVIWSQAFEGPVTETPRYEDAMAAGIGEALKR